MRFQKNHQYFVRKYSRRALPVRAKSAADATTETGEQEADGEDEEEADGDKGDSSTDAKSEPTFTQEQVNAILAKEKQKREKAEARKKKEDEDKKLEADKEFERLANERKTELAEVTAEKEQFEAEVTTERARADRYEAALQKYAKEAKKGLPKGVLALLDKLPVDEQLAWIAENKPAKEGDEGTPKTPRGNGSGASQEVIERRRKATQRDYRNSF